MNREPENKTWNGEQLALAVAADFEGFFDSVANLKVPVAVEPCRSPCVRTNAAGSRIAIPIDMASEEIDSSDRLFFHLIILGHEIAHIVHRHTHAGDLEHDDDAALELWADFYGAKSMMAIVTYGPKINEFFTQFFPERLEVVERLESIGRACGRLVESVYSDDPRYPSPLTRVGLIFCGVVSFIRHHSADAQMDPIWYYSVFKRIFAPDPIQKLMLFSESEAFDPEPLMRARRWHQREQGSRPSIVPGLRPELQKFLHTTFNQTEDELAASINARLAELREGPYNLDMDDLSTD